METLDISERSGTEAARKSGTDSEDGADCAKGAAEGRRLFAVIVSYRPDWNHLLKLSAELAAQNVRAIIVDNASNIAASRIEDFLSTQPPGHALWIQNQRNEGLGAAQNTGIRAALKHGADYVTLLDQDSMPYTSMFTTLCDALSDLRSKGHQVFAVGPRLMDERSGDTVPFISYDGGRKRRHRCQAHEPPVECFSLLASGTTFDREGLAAVGMLDEGLFIEYVDVEWGARARDKGWLCFGVPAAGMQHSLGDARMKVAGRLKLPLHSPLRHYYSFRNAMLMQKKPYVPGFWKRADLLRCAATAPLFIAFAGQPFSQLKMIALGLLHGLRGIQGPYEAQRQA